MARNGKSGNVRLTRVSLGVVSLFLKNHTLRTPKTCPLVCLFASLFFVLRLGFLRYHELASSMLRLRNAARTLGLHRYHSTSRHKPILKRSSNSVDRLI